MSSRWDRWQDIICIEDFTELCVWPGVYEIRLSASDGQPLNIPRLLANDAEGILTIGESKNVAERVRSFYKASNGYHSAHSEAERMYLVKFWTEFQKSVYRGSKIQVRSLRLRNKADAEERKERLLKLYFKKFGELPPLNGALPNKSVDWNSLRPEDAG